jgi:hypothetical protein
MSVVFYSLLFVPCRASSNGVKRDISITKGMELAQLPAKYVHYLITEVLYERPTINKRKRKLVSDTVAEAVC